MHVELPSLERGRSAALVGLTRKTLENPTAIGRSIAMACQAAVGIDRLLPVFHGGRVVAFVHGLVNSSDVYWRLAGYSTYDDVISEISAGKAFQNQWCKAQMTAPVANNWYDLWPVGGNPQAGTYPGAARVATQWDDTAAGALLHGGNVTPDTKHLLVEGINTIATTATIMIYDRVLTYEACTITNANQVMDNTLPALRYIGGSDPGLKVMITAQTALGATANAYTQLQYTDQAGNTLQSMPVAFGVNVIASAAAPTTQLGARVVSPTVSGGTFAFNPAMALAAGDSGVRLIDNYTHSANNTGTLCYVLYAPIAMLPIQQAGAMTMVDMVNQIAGLYRVYDGACLAIALWTPTATANIVPSGRIELGWG